MAKHLSNIQIKRPNTVCLLESKVSISGCFAYDIHRSAFAIGNLLNVCEMLLLDKQSHAFLALICYDFLSAERGVADGELVHLNQSSTFLDKF